ncbi:MAG: N4-gp56 family major capsid protein [Clostridia bacterium]|nr:N4-gp56 family major capsid protein [Clostridia bacterium]
MNTTLNTANTAYFNKQFYDKKLLETAKTRLVHASFGQKRSIPRHGGKRVEFRKYDLFTPDADALTLVEGVTPTGQSLTQSKVEAEVSQYGAYVEVSDLLDLTAYDEVLADSAELLGEQLGTVIEWVTRDAMCATTNVQYANGKSGRNDLLPTDVLTVDEIRKAVRTLKKNKARTFATAIDGSVRRPHYVCICSPDATYDLQNDPLWQDVSKYSNAEQIYSGEIGRLFGVVFVESTEAKVYRQTVYNKAESAGSNTRVVVLANDPDDRAKKYLSKPGNKVFIGTNEVTITAFDPVENELMFSEQISFAANAEVYTKDAGKAGSGTQKEPDIHATLVFGADAYGVIDVDGSGTMETIVKPHGSEGSGDPLNQRATVGAKVAAYAAKVLNPLWLVRIEHGVSA